jgi:hypothetical protein
VLSFSLSSELVLRTSAAAAAAALGSLTALPSPSVLAGPPTVRFPAVAALPGIDALVAGAGASPRVRPGPSKFASDCFPQQLPIGEMRACVGVVRAIGGRGGPRGVERWGGRVKGGDTQPPQPSRGLPRYGIVAPRLATSMTWKCLVPDLGDAGLGLSTAIVVFIFWL